jgi:hypothetical protein
MITLDAQRANVALTDSTAIGSAVVGVTIIARIVRTLTAARTGRTGNPATEDVRDAARLITIGDTVGTRHAANGGTRIFVRDASADFRRGIEMQTLYAQGAHVAFTDSAAVRTAVGGVTTVIRIVDTLGLAGTRQTSEAPASGPVDGHASDQRLAFVLGSLCLLLRLSRATPYERKTSAAGKH